MFLPSYPRCDDKHQGIVAHSIPIAVPVRPVITRHSHFIAPQPKRRFVFCDVIPGYELEQYPEA